MYDAFENNFDTKLEFGKYIKYLLVEFFFLNLSSHILKLTKQPGMFGVLLRHGWVKTTECLNH